jgi:hypothetical protein
MSRLNDHIRALCSKIVVSNDADLEPAIAELKMALREHTEHLRKLAAEKLVISGSRSSDFE